MLAASGCHKDSFNFDEFTRPTTATPDTNPDNDDGTGTPDDGDEIPVPMNLPVVSIATGDMPIEDGAGVTLTITSSETVPATLTGGLSVTINIVGADAADFNNAVCTDIVCIVTIPVGGMTVSLILSPLSDFSTETERWTATLEDGDDYNLDAGNNNVGFDITDLIAVVDIMTSDTTAIENGAVTLTITSDLAAPAGGLSVTIDISGNGLMTGEFTTNADCTGLQCVVIIPVGGMTVSLILSPLSDFSTEPGERWTATLVDTGAYNPAAGGDDNVGFDITDLIAALGIATSNTEIIEGGAAVTLTITSSETVPATLTDGLTVTINIGDADDGEFTSANCIALVCEVVIDPTETTAILIITPSPDTAPEGGSEDWTATIAPDTDNNIFMVDSSTDNAVFAVANVLPPVVDSTDLDDLNAYNTPTALSVNAMRAGVESASVGAIGGFQYNDADGNPRVLVERLDFANLGIWINGDITAADFNFAPLNINVVTPPTTSSALPTATYALEGEMTYNGNRFYPDGALMADFANAEVSGEISLDGQQAADDFGGTTLADGTTAITNSDNLILGLNAAGISGGFSGALNIITAEGFFSSLSGRPTGTYSGRFNDDIPNYDAATAAPQEVSGIFGGITDANGNALNGGFLGQCSADCRLPIIGILTSDTAIEGGAVTLTISSDLAVPAALTGGLSVTINIGGADNADFTSAACTTPPQCVVVIASGMRTATLIIMASSTDTDTIAEEWTAAIAIPANGDFTADPANADANFIISETALPAVANNLLLSALDAYTIQAVLATNEIRAGGDGGQFATTPITGFQYNDADGNPQVFVQRAEFAALGIWVNGNAPNLAEFDHDYDYAFLGDNVVSTLPNSGTATYRVEGDATYKGVNFFPDGIVAADFGGGIFSTSITADGSTATTRTDDFGDANAMVPMTGGGMRPVTGTDNINIQFDATITGNEFQGTPTFTAGGFFSDLAGFDSAASSFSGRFYDSVPNPATAPRELSGVMEIIDAQGNLNMGFLGRR